MHFFNENISISIKISLKFVLKAPINNIPALVQIKAFRRPDNMLLSETMMVCLLTHICVTRPKCVNFNNGKTTMQHSKGIVFHEKGFQLPSPSQCLEMLEMKICIIFPKMNSARQDYYYAYVIIGGGLKGSTVIIFLNGTLCYYSETCLQRPPL